MSRRAVTRAGSICALVLGAWAIAAAWRPVSSRAQAPHVVWIGGRPSGEVAGRARRWARRVGRVLAQRGAEVTDELESWAHGPPGVDADRVARLAAVERSLHDAQAARAQLRFREAFERLAEAERTVLEVLDVPGANAWYAEVELAIAVTASEVGAAALSSAALARASTVDPGRVLGAAEAPPDLVARAIAIQREVATGPRGRFDLRADVPGATVFLDGRRLGTAPLRIEASVGTHVLRIEAPGHRIWARRIDVFEGARAALEVTLAPDAALHAARMLRDAVDAGDIDRVLAALAALETSGRAPRALWWIEASSGAIDRAIVMPCRPGGCGEPIRIDVGRVESILPEDPDDIGPLARPELARARRWLDEPIPIEAPPSPAAPWWEEPWVWAVAGVIVAGASAASIGAAWQPPGEQRVVIVDGTEEVFPPR